MVVKGDDTVHHRLFYMNLGVYPKLTKDYILKKVSQEQIMEHYLGIPVVLDNLIKAPKLIRPNDENPTCAFYYNSQGRLRFRDLAGYFWGDCFDVVAKAITVDASDKRGFQMILHTIAKDFKIHKYENYNEVKNYYTVTANHFQRIKSRGKLRFKIIPRKINYHDIDYWKQFNITPKLLILGKVYFAQEVHISTHGVEYARIYSYNPKDPAYCYYNGKDENKIDEWKIYYPFREKGQKKFHSNSSFLQGKHLITCGRVCIVTKSYKDVLSFFSFGLQAVGISSETVLLSKEDYFWLKSRFDFVVSCMDYDKTGMVMANKLRKAYNIEPFMFTNGRFDTLNYKAKDFAEYVNNNGAKVTKELLLSIFDRYTETFRELDKETYNKLKFIK